VADKIPVEQIFGSKNGRSGAKVEIGCREVVVVVRAQENIVVGKVGVDDWVLERIRTRERFGYRWGQRGNPEGDASKK
jgi:hypothetical protein